MYASPGGNLEEQVRHQLLMLPYYNVFDNLSFRVDNGTVILMGQVTQPVVKDDAETFGEAPGRREVRQKRN